MEHNPAVVALMKSTAHDDMVPLYVARISTFAGDASLTVIFTDHEGTFLRS